MRHIRVYGEERAFLERIDAFVEAQAKRLAQFAPTIARVEL